MLQTRNGVISEPQTLGARAIERVGWIWRKIASIAEDLYGQLAHQLYHFYPLFLHRHKVY